MITIGTQNNSLTLNIIEEFQWKRNENSPNATQKQIKRRTSVLSYITSKKEWKYCLVIEVIRVDDQIFFYVEWKI